MLSPVRNRRGVRALAAGLGLGLAASSVAVIATPAYAADPVDIQIIGTNDFHGRILPNFGPFNLEGGAAVMAGAVDELEAEYPNTVFSAAGDLIGASTFESFIAHDKPTIDALNAAGLDVSAVGNHEFDQGYDDLVNRVMAPYDADTNPFGGAEWAYIGANVRMKSSGDPAVPETWMKTFGTGDSAVDVGFVGAVTEHLDELVSPAGIADITVTDIVDATNDATAGLKASGAELVVLLVHEGAATTALADATDPASDFGKIVNGVGPDVDAIISGHTHLAYNHAIPVQEWADQGRPVTTRPVVSAGQYGMNLNQLVFTWDNDTDQVTGISQEILPLVTDGAGAYPADPEVTEIVEAAAAEAEELGKQPLGEIGGAFKRGKALDPDGDDEGTEPDLVENRGAESTLGNLVAEVQQWATSTEEAGAAELAFMNPGGLRADMVGNADEGYPAVLTYKQAAVVQPFANTLVNMHLTGAQIRSLLEEQWQPAGSSRPFLKLGVSEGFEYTYDPDAPAGERITAMWLNGERITEDRSVSVTVNSFLASGGDNFETLTEGTQRRDTGKTDLQAMVDYLAEFGSADPVQVAYDQRAVGVDPATADTRPTNRADAEPYGPGDTVAMDLSSLSFTNESDLKDAAVTVSLKGQELGRFPVDSSLMPPGSPKFDEVGSAGVEVTLPQYVGKPAGLLVTGEQTGTEILVPLDLERVRKAGATMTLRQAPQRVVVNRTNPRIHVRVTADGEPTTGKVTIFLRGAPRSWSAMLKEANGKVMIVLPEFRTTGQQRLRVKYYGNGTTKQTQEFHRFWVHRR